MKELSIEDKAKHYDEAIERAKKWYNAPNVDKIPTFGNRVIEEVFPELKESEDERIRKTLLYYHKNAPEQYTCGGLTNAEVVAWLEKQGEQKPTKNKDYSAPLDIEIPFGAKDSELIQETIRIPDGCHAFIEGNEIVIESCLE